MQLTEMRCKAKDVNQTLMRVNDKNIMKKIKSFVCQYNIEML